MPPAAILDIDGTLVDTNYHHAIAWHRAFRRHDEHLPVWRIHRSIGMGGDQLVESLAASGWRTKRATTSATRSGALHGADRRGRALHGARDLVVDLKRSGHTVVLASSGQDDEVAHYLDLLDARELADDWTTSEDVESTKPEPDLVVAAIEKAGGGPAVMVGDSVFDCEAARRAGVDTLAVLTGGFSEQELLDAGALRVFGSIEELRRELGATPLAG